MKTEYVTLGIGPVFEEMAQLAAQLFTKINNVPVRVITGKDLPKSLPHPWWGKAYIWDLVDPDTERILYFDSDMISQKPLGELPDGKFVASLDGGAKTHILPDLQERKINLPELDLDNYFNSGLFICTRDTRPIFDEFKKYPCDFDKYGRFPEQTIFNMLVKKHLGNWSKLPIGFVNVLTRDSFTNHIVKLMHLAGYLGKKTEIPKLILDELDALPTKKKVVIYAIAKNEEKFVDKFMLSSQEADQVVILDTGSTDKTVELFKSWGATVHETKFESWANLEEHDLLLANGKKPFRFDTARNMSLDLVPEDTDICVSLDIDEVLPTDWRTKIETAWVPGTTRLKYMFAWKVDDQDKPEVFFSYSKIHARQGYHWRFPAHEYIYQKTGMTEVVRQLPDFIVKHYPDNTKPRAYYKNLLALGVRENPDDTRAAYYYGRELIYTGEQEKGIAELKRYLTIPASIWPDERAKAMSFIASAYSRLKQEDQVIPWLLRSVAEQPKIRDTWVALSEAYYERKDHLACYYAVRQALNIKKCEPSHATSMRCWNYYPHEVASVCAFNLGLKANAALHLRNALIHSPNDKELIAKKAILEQEHELPVITLSRKHKSCLRCEIIECVT